jgi:hypothetical protein
MAEEQVTTTIEQAPGAASHRALRKVEKVIGADLPSQYREFLAKHGGGRPVPATFRVGEGIGGTINEFYDIDGLSDTYRVFQGRIPAHLLAIGYDGCGNQVCLAVSGEELGSVWFWDHEGEPPEGAEPATSNLHRIAPSFTLFLDGLHAVDLKLHPSQVKSVWVKAGFLDELRKKGEL